MAMLSKMLRPPNFFYRLFGANKVNNKTYSCWRNSTPTFGHQFLQIQNGNGNQLSGNILFKPHELYQRYQFCTGNDSIHFPIDSANLSSTPLSITPIKYAFQQSSEGMEKGNVENELTLEIRLLGLDIHNEKKLRLELVKDKSGQKIFRIKLRKSYKKRFPPIPIPEDAYAFVRALDELIGELSAEDFEQKLTIKIKDPQSTSEIATDGHQPIRILKLKTVELTGINQKFQLILLFFPCEHRENEICLELIAIDKSSNKKRIVNLPLHSLPWLRKQMAEMLEKYDGTEEIEEASTQIPKQFLQYLELINED